MKLAVTPAEYTWIERNLNKLVKANQNATQVTKTMELTEALLVKLQTAELVEDPKGNLVFNFNRNDLRILQGLVSNQRIVLRETIIPNYKKRGAGFEDYIKQADEKIDLLTGILEKVEAGLK